MFDYERARSENAQQNKVIHRRRTNRGPREPRGEHRFRYTDQNQNSSSCEFGPTPYHGTPREGINLELGGGHPACGTRNPSPQYCPNFTRAIELEDQEPLCDELACTWSWRDFRHPVLNFRLSTFHSGKKLIQTTRPRKEERPILERTAVTAREERTNCWSKRQTEVAILPSIAVVLLEPSDDLHLTRSRRVA